MDRTSTSETGDPRLTFDLFVTQSNLLPHTFIAGKVLKGHFLKLCNGRNLKYMTEVAKPFSYNQNFIPQRLSFLSSGNIHV